MWKGNLIYYNRLLLIIYQAVEYYSANNDPNHSSYLDLMKGVLMREDVQKVVYGEDPNSNRNK